MAVQSGFFKVLLSLFLTSWVFLLWPSSFDVEEVAMTESSDVRKELSFICRDGNLFRQHLTHRLSYDSKSSPSSMESHLAAACLIEPPIRLLSDDQVVQVIDASLQPGFYIVEPAKPADSVVTRRRLKQQERETREMDLEDMEVSQRADLRRQKREMEERERIRREAKAAPKKPTEDVQSKIRQRAEEERKAFLARIATNRTQIEPPPNTDTIIYPNPMRHPAAASGNITYLSGAINIGRKQHAGKRPEDYRFEDDYLQIMRLVLSWRKPVQLVMQRKYYEMLKKDLHDQAIVRIVEVEDLRAWKYYPMIERIRKTKNWQKLASWLPASPQAYSDLYNPVIMSKVYWLQDLCRSNPFQTQYFMWVDCGVCTTGLSADMMDFLGRRFEAMMEPGLLATISPAGERDEIQGFVRSKLEEMAGQPAPYIMKGGTFGGTCEKIEKFVEYYDRALEQSLREGYLGTEESIYTLVFYKHNEIFHEFKQERIPGYEVLCLMNDRSYHIPAFKERYVN